MNLLKLTISSLALIIACTNNGLSQESEYPVGVKVNPEGEFAITKALIDLSAPFGGTSIRYQSYGATGMQNRDNVNVSYAGGGCMQLGGRMDASVDLPSGARIISISYEVNDNSATGSAGGQTLVFDGAGGFLNLLTLNTTIGDTLGYVSIGGFLDHTISPNENMVVRLNATSETGVEICGVRIGFIPPSVASDVIFVHNFQR